MPAVKYHIKIERGADKVIPIRWGSQGATEGSILPFDLTGCTARLQIREELDSPTPLDSMTTENGRITIDTTARRISLLFPHLWSSAAPWDAGVYQLELVDAAGTVHRLMQGKIRIDLEGTRE